MNDTIVGQLLNKFEAAKVISRFTKKKKASLGEVNETESLKIIKEAIEKLKSKDRLLDYETWSGTSKGYRVIQRAYKEGQDYIFVSKKDGSINLNNDFKITVGESVYREDHFTDIIRSILADKAEFYYEKDMNKSAGSAWTNKKTLFHATVNKQHVRIVVTQQASTGKFMGNGDGDVIIYC